jgi:threonine aldolase
MGGMRGFASDNNATVHPKVMAALGKANQGHVVAYGDDPFTERARLLLKKTFGSRSEPFLVFNGTAANVLCLKALAQPYQAVICAESAHVNVDECGAPERLTGCKLLPVPAPDGKLTVERVRAAIKGVGDQHHVQPKVVTVAQATEWGTVYRPAELQALADFAHSRGMYFHVDGARLANAAASLGVSLKEACRGADAVSFGGTKNGILGGEAVVLLNPAIAEGFKFHRKQLMQLSSKMRFIACQFEALLTGGLWLENAGRANRMAALLGREVAALPGISLVQKVEANAVFARVPRALIAPLQKKFFFYVWNEERNEVRWMTSFDTTTSDVDRFVAAIRSLSAKGSSAPARRSRRRSR